jgi:flagellin
MGIRINQNVMAMNAYRNLTTTEGQLSRSLERLSSGFRINRAADDAAGLVISEGLRSQVNGLKMATRNAQDGVSVVQTAEGALTETHAILQRMRELAVQAASTGSSDQPSRDAAQVEIVQLREELDRIANTTKFGEQTLLNGDYGVTQATVTGANSSLDMTSFVITAGANDALTVTTTVDGVATNTFNMTLTAAAAGTSSATDLENNLNGAFVAAGGDLNNLRFDVELGNDGFFQTTITAANNLSFDVGAPANNANAALGLTAVAAYAAGGATIGTQYHQPSGTGGEFQVGSGTSSDDKITIAIGDMTSGATGLALTALDVSDSNLSTANITAIDAAITEVSTLRGNLGAYQNRFERTISNLSVTTENLSASESRIRDTDMASEMMSFTRAQILQQAGTAMLAQANSVPQSVLQLLQ